MKKIIIIIIIFNIYILSNNIFALKGLGTKVVKHFIKVVKNNNKKELAKLIRFPLRREHPIPSIKNANDFIKRFNEVFDKKLIKIISKSDVKNDWSDMGWRGIMLKDGILWMDFDGTIIGINYQSEIEKSKRTKLINAEKKKIHKSLKNYESNVLEWRTKKYRIRIDSLADEEYRYTVWPAKKDINEKPDLILYKGKWIPDGNGGNGYYEFINSIYKYQCYEFVIGSDETPPGILTVFKNDKVIVEEIVLEVIKP